MADSVEFIYDNEKSEWLRKHRGLGFEEIIEYIEDGWVLDIVPHSNQKAHPDQWVYEIDVEGYIFEAPFYKDKGKHCLKTLYPSRKATKKHIDEGTLL